MGKDGEKIDDILLTEIRLNRKDIASLRTEIAKLDKDVFGNKIKLGLFMAGISLFSSIIVILIAEKIKSLMIAA